LKQENRFVAQLFHYLAPFVDLERDLFICVDGFAARQNSGAQSSPLLDPDVPDLWLAFVGHTQHTGIEAKIVDENRISVRQSQIKAWRTGGTGAYCPRFWVASDRPLKTFLCWEHSALISKLDATKSEQDNVTLSVVSIPRAHESKSLAELALYILSKL